MVFQRIFPLLVVLVLAGACTPENNPPQTAAAAQGGVSLPRDVEREVGPAYQSPALQALVSRVGPEAGRQFRSFRHLSLLRARSAGRHAHAMSSGYVFVTRGLLALMDDEAELAAAMGHELGHIIAEARRPAGAGAPRRARIGG